MGEKDEEMDGYREEPELPVRERGREKGEERREEEYIYLE